VALLHGLGTRAHEGIRPLHSLTARERRGQNGNLLLALLLLLLLLRAPGDRNLQGGGEEGEAEHDCQHHGLHPAGRHLCALFVGLKQNMQEQVQTTLYAHRVDIVCSVRSMRTQLSHAYVH
jgi:hypothetical protein